MAKADLAVKRGARSPLLAAAALVLAGLAAACGERGELLGTVVSLSPPQFAPPQPVAALSDPAAIDEDPTFTGDLLELYFMSTRGGGKDIWVSRRAAAADAWGPPAPVPELSSPASDWAPAVSLDGLTVWFATDRDGPDGHIWRAARAARTEPWDAPAAVPELASAGVDFAPAVDAAETTLLFSSNRPGSAGYDVYAAGRRAGGAPWGTPAPAPGINSASDEYDPFVAQGGLVVFFTSMRSGAGDIFWSARRSTGEPFQPPVPLPELDSPAYDSDTTLSADLTYLMFSSTRSGNAEIYETRAVR